MQLQGLANWIGQFDPLVRLLLSRTRALLKIFKRRKLDAPFVLSPGMRLSLVKWLSFPSLPQALGNPSPTILIQTDASLQGWGFQINQTAFRGKFDTSMAYSINTLELLTIWFALLMVEESHVVIQVLCDNSTAVAAVRRGTSTVFHHASLAELIWKRATTLGWTLSAAHIQGRYNVIADQLSRDTTLLTEWSLTDRDFRQILNRHRK